MPVLEGQVVQLVLGVKGDFPVGFLGDAIGVGAGELPEVGRAELLGNAAEIVAQALLRVGSQVDENKPLPDLGRNGGQTVFAFVEIKKVLLIRNPGQPACRIVGPTVEAARQDARTRAPVIPDECVAAVRADIVKGANHLVRAADDENGRPTHRDVLNEIVSRFGNRLHPANVQPGPTKNPLTFELEICRGDARLCRDRAGADLRIFFHPAFVSDDHLHARLLLSCFSSYSPLA